MPHPGMPLNKKQVTHKYCFCMWQPKYYIVDVCPRPQLITLMLKSFPIKSSESVKMKSGGVSCYELKDFNSALIAGSQYS